MVDVPSIHVKIMTPVLLLIFSVKTRVTCIREFTPTIIIYTSCTVPTTTILLFMFSRFPVLPNEIPPVHQYLSERLFTLSCPRLYFPI